jgi:hypothetical protein
MAGNGKKRNDKGQKMSPQEAGRLGGSAYHEKRGQHGSDNR